MPHNSVGVVYGARSGIIRRIISTDQPDTLTDGTHSLAKGEAMLVLGIVQGPLGVAVADAVSTVVGKQPPSGRTAVVDKTGAVIAVIAADPDIDSIQGATLVLHDDAAVGWITVDGVLTAPVAAADAPLDPVGPALGGTQ